MESYIIEWLSLLGRWVHMIVGIAWIGASFYFVWLDNHLQQPVKQQDADSGVAGEIWSVHGGGFYHAQKYQVAPEALPDKLHWFKWEAYTTWISGMFLLALLYWYSAEIYLIDPNVADLSKPVAILIGIACIALGWFAYDFLCRSAIGNNEKLVALIMLVVLTVVAYVLCQLFSGRGAYMHFGAMLGTIMVANVFFIIIPGQKDLVAAKLADRTPDPIHGIRGKQRSVHNTYFTLPVLFVMISNHYAMTYTHQYNWLILMVISLAGALIRVYFVARHRGKASLLPLIIAFALLAGVITAIAPKPAITSAQTTDSATQGTNDALVINASFAQVQEIVENRCTGCHAMKPTIPGFYAPPAGVVLETPEQIVAQAQAIHQQTVLTKAMPIGNLTKITDEERAILGAWYEKGASAQ